MIHPECIHFSAGIYKCRQMVLDGSKQDLADLASLGEASGLIKRSGNGMCTCIFCIVYTYCPYWDRYFLYFVCIYNMYICIEYYRHTITRVHKVLSRAIHPSFVSADLR